MLKSKKPRRPILIQQRDIAFLQCLFESRIITLAQAASLSFDDRMDAAKQRLGKLKRAGLIKNRPRELFERSTLVITNSGIELLRGRGILRDYLALSSAALERRMRVSPLTLTHELCVMDLKTALCSAVRKTANACVIEFTTWPALNQFESRGRMIKPDAFVRLHEKRWDGRTIEHCFFVELDRSTESRHKLVARADAYREHYTSGGFARSRGISVALYKEHPFRSLFVLTSEESRNNFIERLLDGPKPILSHAWVTTIDDFTADPLGPIWIRPVDYRNAFTNVGRNSPTPLRAKGRADRDSFVRTSVPRLRLF